MFPSRRRQRTFKPALAPLEERLALSALPLVAQEVHSLPKRTPPIQNEISGTMTLTHGTDLQFTNLNVTFGPLKLKGSGSGTFSGGRIVNGELHLSGPKGKMTLQLLGGPSKKVGKQEWQFDTGFLITNATGAYAPAGGFVGAWYADNLPTGGQLDPIDPSPYYYFMVRGVVNFDSPPSAMAQEVFHEIEQGYATPPHCCR
jgi:hypothetical protein